MQRSSVLLPEPELPIIAITSPLPAVSDTPFSTSSEPKLLCRSLTTRAGAVPTAMSIAAAPALVAPKHANLPPRSGQARPCASDAQANRS